MSIRGTFAGLTQRFAHSSRGVAAVEFALILPVMLLVYVGCVEASALISMDRKVQSVVGALGDLVSRTESNLTKSTLTDYFQASSGIMVPYPTEGVLQTVTSVWVKADGSTSIMWSRDFKDGKLAKGAARKENASYNLPQAMIDIAKNSYVIVSEASVSYTPFYGIVYDKPINLYRQNFYMPRFGKEIKTDTL